MDLLALKIFFKNKFVEIWAIVYKTLKVLIAIAIYIGLCFTIKHFFHTSIKESFVLPIIGGLILLIILCINYFWISDNWIKAKKEANDIRSQRQDS